jgi:glycosyltransferase involved in cell wall biosynthesis
MAAGRPIVATAVDGVPEAVQHGRNGLLFPPGDVEAGAAHVLALLADPELRRRMANEGRTAAGEFAAERMIEAQEQLYSELLAERGAR